jgi:hypothetical protein
MNPIIGAFTFNRQAYAEVKHDAEFTKMAWLLMIVANFLGQFGANAIDGRSDPDQWIRSTIIGTLLAIGVFNIGVAIVHEVGRQAFNAEVSREALFRTLGLASVWSAVGVLGVLAAMTSTPGTVLMLTSVATIVLGLAAWLLAAKEALDLDWMQVVVTVTVAWIVSMIVLVLVGILLALL